MDVEPVYGASERPPRGDYSRAQADYTCPQHYAVYTEANHDTWRGRAPHPAPRGH